MTAKFFAKLDPKPFKSFHALEKDRIEQIKLAKIKAAEKPSPEEPPEITREPFYD